MSDTVGVALIAVGGTLGSGLLSYLAAKQSTTVQLRGVETDMERLRETHAEEHRKERQAVYQETLTVIEKIRQLSFGVTGPASEEAYLEAIAQFGACHTNLVFIGSNEVVDVMQEMVVVVGEFSTLASEDEETESLQDILKKSFIQVREEWNSTELRLIDAMKQDVRAARQAERAQREPDAT